MLQKRSFKVLSPIPKKDGGQFWLRLGTAHTNKDNSINVYLDAIPKDSKLQLRELTEEDLRPRGEGANRTDARDVRTDLHHDLHPDAPHAATAADAPPF